MHAKLHMHSNRVTEVNKYQNLLFASRGKLLSEHPCFSPHQKFFLLLIGVMKINLDSFHQDNHNLSFIELWITIVKKIKPKKCVTAVQN
jgi:hypothetical protein